MEDIQVEQNQSKIVGSLKKSVDNSFPVPLNLIEIQPKLANLLNKLITIIDDNRVYNNAKDIFITKTEIAKEEGKLQLTKTLQDQAKLKQNGGNLFFTKEECSFF